jgi:hybrid cluster-associated redox disulfide protein
MSEPIETMIVGDVMAQWPATVPVFIRNHMACPGCVMAPFMTIREAAREYGLRPDALVRELSDAIQPAQD